MTKSMIVINPFLYFDWCGAFLVGMSIFSRATCAIVGEVRMNVLKWKTISNLVSPTVIFSIKSCLLFSVESRKIFVRKLWSLFTIHSPWRISLRFSTYGPYICQLTPSGKGINSFDYFWSLFRLMLVITCLSYLLMGMLGLLSLLRLLDAYNKICLLSFGSRLFNIRQFHSLGVGLDLAQGLTSYHAALFVYINQ